MCYFIIQLFYYNNYKLKRWKGRKQKSEGEGRKLPEKESERQVEGHWFPEKQEKEGTCYYLYIIIFKKNWGAFRKGADERKCQRGCFRLAQVQYVHNIQQCNGESCLMVQ